MMTENTATSSTSISVNYHGLPEYLRRDGIRRAKAAFGLGLADLMQGRAEFRLSTLDKETERRSILDVIRTTIA